MDELPRSAVALAAMLRRGDVSSVELTRHHLETIARRNPELGAFVEVHRDRALRAAARADARRRAGGPLPAFLGLPTGIKDHEHLRGHFTRVG
jgi:aspartyl-tRNA(Asn)/glutamyl-tRNA(Gln) amidotransferase subunit A